MGPTRSPGPASGQPRADESQPGAGGHSGRLAPPTGSATPTRWITRTFRRAYLPDTNVIVTSQRLNAGGNNILVQQFDFSPKGIAYPLDEGAFSGACSSNGYILTNQAASGVTANVYMYMDPALNGGDIHDSMFTDAARGAMVAFDNTYRIVTGTGAIGPRVQPDHHRRLQQGRLRLPRRRGEAVQRGGRRAGQHAPDFGGAT